MLNQHGISNRIFIDIEAMYQSFYKPTGTRVTSISIAFWPPNVNLIVHKQNPPPENVFFNAV